MNLYSRSARFFRRATPLVLVLSLLLSGVLPSQGKSGHAHPPDCKEPTGNTVLGRLGRDLLEMYTLGVHPHNHAPNASTAVPGDSNLLQMFEGTDSLVDVSGHVNVNVGPVGYTTDTREKWPNAFTGIEVPNGGGAGGLPYYPHGPGPLPPVLTLFKYRPPPGDPCEGENPNDICTVASCGCGATWCDCSYITTSPPQVGIPYAPQVFQATSADSATGGWHAAITGVPGSGSFFYRYHDVNTNEQPRLEVRSVDGSITLYEVFGALSASQRNERLRPIESVDAYDNVTRYLYDSHGRMNRVQYPNGIDEVWDYSPSWVPNNAHSGIEIRFEDAANSVQPPEVSNRKFYLLFEHDVAEPLAKPFAGDRLLRVYGPLQELLSAAPLAGSTYQLPASPEEWHQVIEFDYHPGTHRVSTISHLLADGPGAGANETTPTTIANFTYQQVAGGQFRVQTESLPLRGGTVHSFTYYVDTADRVDTVIRENITTGVLVTRNLDDQQRTLSVTYTPPSGAAARPRAADPDNGGWAEPTEVTYNFAYSSCVNCDKPVVVEQLPSGRRDEYDYYPATGLLWRHRHADPSGQPGMVETEYTWEPIDPTILYGGYRIKSIEYPDNTVWSYDYVDLPRATPADRVSWGRKSLAVIVTSPTIELADSTTTTVGTTSVFDLSAPTVDSLGRQLSLTGVLAQIIDGDGVTTAYSPNPYGYIETVTVNPGGGPDEIVTAILSNRLGYPTSVTSNATSAAPAQSIIHRDGSGRVTGTETVVDGQLVAERFHYDAWGNLAVHLSSNQGPGGARPDDFGAPGRPDAARDWIRNEWHFDGERLVTHLSDRRTLDRDDQAGPVADGIDARYNKVDYLWLPDGQLHSVIRSNGSVLRYTFDGYGWLYKAELDGPAATLLLRKYFVNEVGEVVREVRETGGQQLVSSIDRNAVGLPTSFTEPSVAAPPGYPAGWAVCSAVHEFDYDVLGRQSERRFFKAPGAPGDLLLRETASFDALGRQYRTQIFEGSSATASQTYLTQWLGASHVAKATGPGGRFVQWFYDAVGRLSERRDSQPSNPNKTTYHYDPKTPFTARVEQVSWDELTGGYVTREMAYLRDCLGRVLELHHGPASAPLIHQFTYYSTGDTASYTDPLGNSELYLPDALGRLAERFRPGPTQILNTAEHRDWTASDNRTELIQVDGLLRETRTIYDFAGRVQVVMKPGATTEPTALDKSQAFARFLEYDGASRLTDIYGADGVHLHIDRDAMGRMIQRTATGANSWVSPFYGGDRVLRDAFGRIVYTRTLDAGGTEYSHEEFDRDALGRTHRESFAYYPGYANWTDIESSFAGGDPLRTGVAYENNLPANADDLWIDVARDAVGRTSSIRWRVGEGDPSTDLASYLYDGGKVRERQTTLFSTHAAFQTHYAYDAYGRTKQVSQSFDPLAGVTFYYDDASNLLKEEYKKQGVASAKGDRFAYDEHNRLQKAWLGSDQAHFDQTDPEGGLGSYIKRLTYGLDAANNRSHVESEFGPGGAVSDPQYHLQADSNRYEEAEGIKPLYDDRGNMIFDGQRYLVYNARDELTEVYVVDEGAQQALSVGSSQMSASASTPQPVGMSPTGIASATQYSVSDVTALRQARANILARMSNDLATVLHQHGQATFAQLASEPLNAALVQPATQQGSSATTGGGLPLAGTSQSATASSTEPQFESLQLRLIAVYLYDTYGRRVIRMVEGWPIFYYAWDGWEEAQEMTFAAWVPETGDPYAVTRPITQNVWGGQLDELVAYRHRDGVPPSDVQPPAWRDYYVAEGGAHCPSRVLDGQGNVVEIQEYDPYGKTSFFEGNGVPGGDYTKFAVWNLFHWKGHRVDWETGLVYARHRFYSPSIGRFLSQDPLGVWGDPYSSGNDYAYGACSPLCKGDPLGLQVVEKEIGVVRSDGGVVGLGGASGDIGVQIEGVSRVWHQAHSGEDLSGIKQADVHVDDLNLKIFDMAMNEWKGGWRDPTPAELGDIRYRMLRMWDKTNVFLIRVGAETAMLATGASGAVSGAAGSGFARPPVGVPVRSNPTTGGASGPSASNPGGASSAPKPSGPAVAPKAELPVPVTGVPRPCPPGLGNIGQGPVPINVALGNGHRWLGPGYRELGFRGSGVFRSADGMRQFRITAGDIAGAHGSVGPHAHFEAFNAMGNITENLHVPIL